METCTEMIPRSTLADLASAYAESEAEIKQACELLTRAQQRLKAVFSQGSNRTCAFDYPRDNGCRGTPDLTGILLEFKKDAWCCLVDRMELRRVMSVKRAAELDKELETGKNMPPVTMENMIAMLESNMSNVKDFLHEAVKEVFDFLRPPGSKYKTNTEFEVGRRVILSWYVVEPKYSGGFTVRYDRQQMLTALDNVFHLLDGKGPIKTWKGPLIDAINATQSGQNTGETEYIKFKCFQNGNLHLEFRRLDLMDKLNQVAGGMRLRQPEAA